METAGAGLKLFGENDISPGFDWPFTPYPRVIPSVFSTEVGSASTGSYPLQPAMGSSPGFASTTRDYVAVLKTRFRCGSLKSLTSPRIVTRWLILQKARRHTVKGAPTARGRAVSGAVSPLSVLFHLSLTVLVRYRSRESVSAWRVVPLLRAGFHVPRATLKPETRCQRPSGTGSHPVPPAFPGRS